MTKAAKKVLREMRRDGLVLVQAGSVYLAKETASGARAMVRATSVSVYHQLLSEKAIVPLLIVPGNYYVYAAVHVAPLWMREHGADYAVPDEIEHLVQAGVLEDASYHNDTCPRFARDLDGKTELNLWVDHPDATKREGQKTRFALYAEHNGPYDPEIVEQTDSVEVIVKAITTFDYEAWKERLKAKRGDAPGPSVPNRVVIAVEGGLVQSVTSQLPLEVLKIDYDTEGAEKTDLEDVPQEDGKAAKAFVSIYEADVMPARVAELYSALA